VVRCRQCRPDAARSAARRRGNCAATIPRITGVAPDESAASRMAEAYRRLVLRDHVRFVSSSAGRQPARAGRCSTWGAAADFFWGMMRERGYRVAGLDFSREARGRGMEAAAGAGGVRGFDQRSAARRQLRGHHHVPTCWSTCPIRAPTWRLRASCWSRMDAWWCRFPTQRHGSSACWDAGGAEWMCRAICSTSAPATWRSCWRTAEWRCAAQVLFAARQPGRPGVECGAGARPHGRGACGGCRRAPARGWPRTWHTWRWRRRRCRLRWRRRPAAPARQS